MVNLIINYYQDNDPIRQLELEECLRRNLMNQYIDRITCLLEKEIPIEHQVEAKSIGRRPTYNDLFRYAREDCWNVVANTDIYFDDSLRMLSNYSADDFLALTRYDVKADAVEFRFVPDAQDTWIFHGKIKPIDADFNPGLPGCDNRLAYLAQRVGYNVVNPALTIKSYHLHRSNVRHYMLSDRIPGPYLTIWPTA